MQVPEPARAPLARAAPPSQQPPSRTRPELAVLALWGLMLGYALLYAWLSWRRFATFHAQIDLSYYLRLCWGLAHGHYDLPLVRAPHILGLHLEPVLLPLVLLHRIGVPLAPLLLGLQAVAVALLGWPAYRLGRRQLGSPAAGLVAALCALLFPTVTCATLHDFHPVTLALAPLLGVIDALDERRFTRALGLGLLALACREDIALQLLLLLGAYALGRDHAPLRALWQAPRSRWLLVGLSLLLMTYFFGYVLLVQPRLLPASGSYGLHFGELLQRLSKGEDAPHSGSGLLAAMLRHPLRLLGFLLTPDRLLYPLVLLWPLALLPILSPRPLAGALPVIGINLLSSFPGVRRLEAHYTTALVPLLVGAALLGAGRLRAWLLSQPRVAPEPARRRAVTPVICAGLLACVTLAHIGHGGSPLAVRSARFQAAMFFDEPDAPAVRAALRRIPPQASVAARPGPLAHLAERPRATSPPDYSDGKPVEIDLSTLLHPPE